MPRGGTPHRLARGLSKRSRQLRFAQPMATLRSLLRSALLVLLSSVSHGLSGEGRIERRLVGEHCTGDGEQAIGDRSQGAPMSMASGT